MSLRLPSFYTILDRRERWLHGLFPTHPGISRLLFMRFQNTGSHGIDRPAIHETTPAVRPGAGIFFLWHSLANRNRTTQWTYKVVDPFLPTHQARRSCLTGRLPLALRGRLRDRAPNFRLCEHSVLSHRRQHYENFQRASLTVD